MPGEPLTCPVCHLRPWRHLTLGLDSEEFLLADHLLADHLNCGQYGHCLPCFCGTVLSNYVFVFMAHFKEYGGAAEHYRAWQLGVDP